MLPYNGHRVGSKTLSDSLYYSLTFEDCYEIEETFVIPKKREPVIDKSFQMNLINQSVAVEDANHAR